MVSKVKAFLRGEDGQGLAEYALILVLISIVAIAAMTPLGEAIRDAFAEIKGHL
ncbi:MAG: Flp family type IVb pilin [Acholeplasmataceae bacterium]|nr:Flp family type IVb pilin [Acholeplasmataceae bacterium]